MARRKAALGLDHPDTLGSMVGVASGYDKLERYPEAFALRAETLRLMKTKLGPEHPDTISSMNNLAAGYNTVGRYADGLALHEQTLTLRKRTLGSDHPDTLKSMNNVANGYFRLDRHAEAATLFEETLALAKVKLGTDHPGTISTMDNLSICYAAVDRNAEALVLRQQTLAFRKARLGDDHPETLRNMGRVASSLVELDRGPEAVPIIDKWVALAAKTEVDPHLVHRMMDLRLRHFEKAGDAAGCRATADMWDQLKLSGPEDLYFAACIRAVTAAVILAADKSEDAKMTAAMEVAQAMVWLKQAVATGYDDASRISQDRDLIHLRVRADFRELMAVLEARQRKTNE